MSNKLHDAIVGRLAWLQGHKLDDKGNASHEYQRRAFARGKDLAEMLCDSVNGMDHQTIAAGFLEGILTSHRFLQNEAIFALLEALGNFGALADYMTDARNEAAHGACGKVREALRDLLFWRDET
jgi:hypothetical protein